jgi:hypothetical protein
MSADEQRDLWGNPCPFQAKRGRPRRATSSRSTTFKHRTHCPKCRESVTVVDWPTGKKTTRCLRCRKETRNRKRVVRKARRMSDPDYRAKCEQAKQDREARFIRNAEKRRNREIRAECKAIQDACIKAWREAAEIRSWEMRWSYREDQRLRYRMQSVERCRQRLNDDPAYKVKHYIRKAIRQKMKAHNARKSTRTFPLVGCSIGHLMAYIEARFKPGMAWNNYGKVWHLDHVRPCASFNLLKLSEQKKCFHYSNLQPLFAQENLSKHSRYLKQPEFL